jgi:hypothetical protein
MGGPRDEDPPLLLSSDPKDQSLNIKPEEITLTFDEYIRLENPSKGIVITPRIKKDEVIFTALKNQVSIKLNQELEDSTTYVFDFQKSVVDISEKNAAENLKLVFSTGNSIDSLTFSGNVNYYFPDARPDFKQVLIGLYPIDDTTNVFTSQPYYLGQVDSIGNFKIGNIKNGQYKAFAWKDQNNNLKAEFKSEDYSFILDTINIKSNVENVQFNLSKADLTPLRILRSTNYGKNFDILLNKNSIESNLEMKDLGKDYYFNTSEKRIRIFPKNPSSDSLLVQLNLVDSVGFSIDTLIWVKFPITERKPDKLETTVNSGKNFYQNLEVELKFNKPVLTINFDSLYFSYDTASRIPVIPSMIHFSDSTQRDLLKIKLSLPDSITADIITLKAADSTFWDIENQFNEKGISANYRKQKREALADEVNGKIIGANPPYIVQLIDSKGVIVNEIFLTGTNIYKFQLIEPGTYTVRVIEDLNGNKRWDPSNFEQGKHAELVFYFVNTEQKKEILLRGGWTLEDQNITATPYTGLQKEK